MSLFLDNNRYDNREIVKKLSEAEYPAGYRPSHRSIEKVVQTFWFYDYYVSLISDPIFFSHLYDFLKENKVVYFSRLNFYNYFFNKILSRYFRGHELEANHNHLMEIALIFEKLQTDTLGLDKFEEYRKKICGKKNIFSSKWLADNKLASIVIDEKDPDKKNLKWAHHSLTEYLTAGYILKQKNPVELAQKLMILDQEGVVAFKPSWIGVLSFLLESEKSKSFIFWILSFAQKYPDIIDENFSKLITSINPSEYPEVKENIFDLIYGYYNTNLFWLPAFTRRQLGKFCSKSQYKTLKKDFQRKFKNETERNVIIGNDIAIIDGMIGLKNELITKTEKEGWKKIFIKFANDKNKNGVLQRHSLEALGNYTDKSIIKKVASNFDIGNSLAKEEFIQMCYRIAPNSEISIDYMVKAITSGISIYGRYGLYEVKTKKGILYLLKKFADNGNLLEAFIDKESIFNREEDYGDNILLKNIKNHLDAEVINALKNVIKNAFKLDGLYYENRSFFLQKLANLIQSKDKNYLFEILENISNSGEKKEISRLSYDYSEFLRFLITPKNVGNFYKQLNAITGQTYPAERAIYLIKREKGVYGEKIYQSALKAGLRPIDEKLTSASTPKFFENNREANIYQEFLKKLEPSPKKYFPDVFEYFVNHKKEIEKLWKNENRERLLKLAVDEILTKVDPKSFKVKITDKSTGDRQFTWTNLASFYGKVISVVNILAPGEVKKFRQNIIDFIPYAYSDDQGVILDTIDKISDDELSWVNSVYLNKKDDRRYLETSSYIYLVGEYQKRGCELITPKEVLTSFVDDPFIMGHEQRYALEQLAYFIDKQDKKTRTYLLSFLKNQKKNDQSRQIANIASSLLTNIYKDESVIKWRFEAIKEKVMRFAGPPLGVVHTVGPEEDEMDRMTFARPLINLNDPKYLPYFFDLLNYSFELLKKNDDLLWNYINYLWRIVIAFVNNLKSQGSFKPFILLEKYSDKYKKRKQANWFFDRINNLKKNYVNYIGQNEYFKNI